MAEGVGADGAVPCAGLPAEGAEGWVVEGWREVDVVGAEGVTEEAGHAAVANADGETVEPGAVELDLDFGGIFAGGIQDGELEGADEFFHLPGGGDLRQGTGYSDS